MKLTPLGKRAILETVDLKKDSIIHIPTRREREPFGKVVAVGDEATVSIGDVVVYNINDFHEIDYYGFEYLIVSYENILAKHEG